ncbi:MAG: [LysW]-aminoadipate kinase [Methanobacteriota archaeon]|nr:MAG: [LysW]-aminoadipate kinase [Euryarchaeota archaeon]
MIVVKVGGAEGNDIDNVLIDLAPRRDYVLVHGGSNEVDRLAEALGRPTRYITSPSGVVSRYTDKETMEVFTMALAGKMNTAIVARLQALGAPAVGLSGVDGGLLTGRRKEAVRAVDNGRVLLVKDDHYGIVEQVNASLIQLLFDAGYVPVISPPGVTPQGELINADADRVAAQIAVAMKAETLVLFTNVPGLLREPSDPTTLIPEVARDRITFFMNFAYGRMKKKLIAAQEALEGGVRRVVIASSQHPDPVERALEGMGTVIA